MTWGMEMITHWSPLASSPVPSLLRHVEYGRLKFLGTFFAVTKRRKDENNPFALTGLIAERRELYLVSLGCGWCRDNPWRFWRR